MLFAVLQQGRAPAGSVRGNRAKQASQLIGAVAVEFTPRAAGQLGNLREQARRHTVVALLKNEDGKAQQAELSRLVTDLVDILLAAIADKHHRVDPALAALVGGVAQQAGNLGATRKAAHRTHQARKFAAVGRPAAYLEFLEAAIEGEPHVETAQTVGGSEHLALYGTGVIPGRLAARGGVHREQQAPTTGATSHRQPLDLTHKCVHGRASFSRHVERSGSVHSVQACCLLVSRRCLAMIHSCPMRYNPPNESARPPQA